jgi:hypothetical protein
MQWNTVLLYRGTGIVIGRFDKTDTGKKEDGT